MDSSLSAELLLSPDQTAAALPSTSGPIRDLSSGTESEDVGAESKATDGASVLMLRSQSAPEAANHVRGESYLPSLVDTTSSNSGLTSEATTPGPRIVVDAAFVQLRTQSAPIRNPSRRFSLLSFFPWKPRGQQEAEMGESETTLQVLSKILRQGTQPVSTALCPICYCNMPVDDLYTTSERCGHRFCKDCLGGWVTVLVTEGKVNQLYCPFDAGMCDGGSEEHKVGMWACPTCTLKNPEVNTSCCACNVPKDKWRCRRCTFFNDRPASHSNLAGAESKTGGAEADASSPDFNSNANHQLDTDLEAGKTSVSCAACGTTQAVLPPPVHPAASGKCGVRLTLEDVATLTSPDVVAKYKRFKANLSNPNNRNCPNPQGCDHHQIGSPSSPAMTCEKCGYHFCFEHSNAHPDSTCQKYEAKIRSDVVRAKQVVKAMGSRPCPHCKFDTLKDSGCNHMTCSGCRKEWCWLCGRKLGAGHESVGHHYESTNLLGCSGMQMDYGATPGCIAVSLRRILHFVHILIAACLAFVCGVAGFLTMFVLSCSLCLICSCVWVSAYNNNGIPKADELLRVVLMFAMGYGFLPAICLLIASFFFGIALNLALLPFTLLAAVWSLFCGDLGADRVEIVRDNATAPKSTCEIAVGIIFMPFIVNFEILKLLTGRQR